MQEHFTVAILQKAPVYNDLQASLRKALSSIETASQKGADLLVMGECWLSGYPAWIDHCPSMALWDHGPTKQAFRCMYANSISVDSAAFAQLKACCADHSIAMCIGINEKVENGPGQGTIYNALCIINEDGELVNHHRKLMPTFTEKLLYGLGDGKGLASVEIKGVKVGGLICWEHWMPLARQAMHNAGEHIHIALWPTVHDLHQLASRHYAVESRCYVVAAGQLMQASDFPAELEKPTHLQEAPDTYVMRGGSAIIGPDGRYILEPVYEKEALWLQELEIGKIWEERMTLDTSGHYQRADVFSLDVNRQRFT